VQGGVKPQRKAREIGNSKELNAQPFKSRPENSKKIYRWKSMFKGETPLAKRSTGSGDQKSRRRGPKDKSRRFKFKASSSERKR